MSLVDEVRLGSMTAMLMSACRNWRPSTASLRKCIGSNQFWPALTSCETFAKSCPSQVSVSARTDGNRGPNCQFRVRTGRQELG